MVALPLEAFCGRVAGRHLPGDAGAVLGIWHGTGICCLVSRQASG
jgi:hypothetical protein